MTSEGLALVERWYLRVGLFLLPLAYSWDTYDHIVLPKLLVARLLVIGLLILFVARALVTRSLVIKRSLLDLPLLTFVGSAVLSTLVAYNQNVAVFGIYSRYDGLLTIVTYAALFWLSVQTLAGPDDARALLLVLLASGYVVAGLAILQSVGNALDHAGFTPATGTMGQKNVLGAFLAMLCPLAYGELVGARSRAARVLAFNALAISGLALFLSFSRSAWLAAGVATLVAAIGIRGPNLRIGMAGVAATLLLVGTVAIFSGGEVQRTDLGEFGDRPAVWRDSLQLIASRPVLGYGPDNFGLVFPRFQAADLHQQWDKAHAETLQVTATQGLVGLAAYVVLVGAFGVAFWRGRRRAAAVAAFAAWLAYTTTLQVNFSAVPSAFPFWVFAAAAMEIWGATNSPEAKAFTRIRLPAAAASLGIAGLLALGTAGIVLPFLADKSLLVAVNADFGGRNRDAQSPAQQARIFWPRESVYAVELGNIAFERGDWSGAREAYGDAAVLGTYNPLVYRNLALADRHLGLLSEGKAAARKAVELDRFDPANRALLAQFQLGTP